MNAPRSTSAAIIVALAFPAGGAALMTGSGNPLDRVLNGGVYALAVVAVALMYSFIAAAFAYSHGSKPGFPLTALALPFVFPMVLSDLSTRVVLDEVMHRYWHSPIDDVTLSIGNIGECMGIESTALAFAFGGVAVSALAGLATRRFTRLWEVVGLSLLAASLFVWLHLMLKTTDDFSAVAWAKTTERFQIVITEGQHVAALRTLSMWLAIASVVACGCGVALRKWRRVDVISAATLVATVGIFVLMSRTTENVLREGIDSRLHLDAPRPPRMSLDALGGDRVGAVYDSMDRAAITRAVREIVGTGVVSVALTPDLPRETLLAVLEVAGEHHENVELIGSLPRFEIPDGLAPMHQELATFLSNQPTWVPASPCREVPAIKFADQHWQSKKLGAQPRFWELPEVSYEWTGSPEELAKASTLAIENGHILCVVLPKQ